MSFASVAFVAFFPIVYGLWLLLRRDERAAVALLLVASLAFYGYDHWKLLPLILAYCGVDWAVARRLERSPRPGRWLALGVTFNLLGLAYFKYTPLLLTTLGPALGWSWAPAAIDGWRVPYGISFYAFTGIAYLVDVYRRTAAAEPSLRRYALSAVFFPHLVAGPILRADEFLTQLRPGRLPTRPLDPLEALTLIARGYFKKMVLADRIAMAIDPFFAHVGDPTTAGVWAMPFVYLYALQIYFDFSGYSDIAIGLGLLFGFRWPENFRAPYLSASVAEFWHRWHVTLSRFLRDYLYIPLGGNRGGWWATQRNLMLTMLLGGLWHGAGWSFLLWGGLHGAFLVIHRAWCDTALRARFAALTGWARHAWRLVGIGFTFHAVCLAWVFFRLPAFAEALTCVGKLVRFDADKFWVGGAADASVWAALAGYGLLATVPRLIPTGEQRPLLRGFAWGYGLAVVALAILLAPGGGSPAFIYFQF